MYEYKVVESPARPGGLFWLQRRGRYAGALSDTINEAALDNREYQQAESGPNNHVVLIFRRHVERLDDVLPVFSSKYAKRRGLKPAPIAPRPVRALRIEDRGLLERLRGGQRRVGPNSKVADAKDIPAGANGEKKAPVIRILPTATEP